MRLYIIDLLRFVAALAVVLYHYTARPSHNIFPQLAEFTRFGYLGVPLFFMISGFVIFASAEKGSSIKFLISRATRLFPSFWVGVSFTLAVVYLTEHQAPSLLQYLANLTMLNDYLGIKNIDGVYWTLQAELKFYFCIFLLLVFGLFPKHKFWLTAWLMLATLYTFTREPFFFPWLINPNYSAFFISGITFFLIYKEGKSSYNFIILAASSALCLYHAHHQAKEFMALATSADAWIAVACIAIFHAIFLLIATRKLTLKQAPIYAVLGGITYPLYLIHNRAGKALLDHYPLVENQLIMITIAIVGALAISYVIFQFIEPLLTRRLKAVLTALHEKLTSQPKIETL